MLPIVEPSPPDVLVRHAETQRLDQPELAVRGDTRSGDVPRVLWNFWLIKDDIPYLAQPRRMTPLFDPLDAVTLSNKSRIETMERFLGTSTESNGILTDSPFRRAPWRYNEILPGQFRSALLLSAMGIQLPCKA